MRKWSFIGVLVLCILGSLLPVSAAPNPDTAVSKGEILFVPHDGRPISDAQTADVVRKLGYEVIVPPQELLGNRDDLGHPAELWAWTEKEIKHVQAAVISSDSMIYGSLVGSRKHSYEPGEVQERAARFAQLRQDNPQVRLYVFGSIMRTPSSGANAGSEEPDYYQTYGSDIFQYTALTDRQETNGLSEKEKQEQKALLQAIPTAALQDWMGRRAKNFAVNHQLIDMVRNGTFDYLILGKDDNAPYSQTHKESRELALYGKGIDATRFQAMTGIDEMGMLLLTRAVNDMTSSKPFICVRYNQGKGGATVPAYSDERIDKSIHSAVLAAGGMEISSPKKADFVLLVNTNPDGRTFEANRRENSLLNTGKAKAHTLYFADMVSDAAAAELPVGIADIAYANGADNALMRELQKRGLLFKIRAYAGWNTATNSSGFVLGEGMLAAAMSDDARDQLLLNRYLEDWGYQANVRTALMEYFHGLHSDAAYSTMDAMKPEAEAWTSQRLREFAMVNLPPFAGISTLQLRFPWNRGFEAEITLGQQ